MKNLLRLLKSMPAPVWLLLLGGVFLLFMIWFGNGGKGFEGMAEGIGLLGIFFCFGLGGLVATLHIIEEWHRKNKTPSVGCSNGDDVG